MEGLPTTQGFVTAPAELIYHLALNDRLTLCQLWLHGDPGQRRRRDDRRLVIEKPSGQFNALCRHCERIAGGAIESERSSLELLIPSRLIDIVI